MRLLKSPRPTHSAFVAATVNDQSKVDLARVCDSDSTGLCQTLKRPSCKVSQLIVSSVAKQNTCSILLRRASFFIAVFCENRLACALHFSSITQVLYFSSETGSAYAEGSPCASSLFSVLSSHRSWRQRSQSKWRILQWCK